MLVVHNLVQEIVDIDFRSRINNRLYLIEQLSKFKALRLGSPTDVLDQACRVLDALIFDIKCLDSARHKKATGVGSELILKNIGHVFEHFPELPVLIRTPVIPGFNDTEEDILGIREMIPRKANIRYEALTYHRMGQPKYGYLGRRYELEGVKADEAFMKRLNIMLKTYEQ